MYSFQLAGKMTAIIVMNIAAFRYPLFLLDWSEQGQSGTYTNVHPACSHCWWRKVIDPERPYFWRWKGVHTARLQYTAGGGKENTLVLHSSYSWRKGMVVKVILALLLAVNFFSPASAFRHQGHRLVRWLYMCSVGCFSTDWHITSSETITGWLKIFGGFSSENTYRD